MGTGDHNAGGLSIQWTSIPSMGGGGGGVAIFLVTSYYRNRS